MMYASVILPLALPQIYVWQIPSHLEQKIKKGVRVEVVLKKTTHYIGIVYQLYDTLPEPVKNIQSILSIIDDTPIISEQQLQLWKFISDYYMCSMGEVMKAALPAPLRLSSDLYIIFNENHDADFSDLNAQEYHLVEELSIKKKLKWNHAITLLKEKNIYPYIQTLFFKNLCTIEEDFKYINHEKTQQHFILNEDNLTTTLTPKQKIIIDTIRNLIKNNQIITRKLLITTTQTSGATIKKLVDLKILCIENKKIHRIDHSDKKINIDFTLSEEQKKAFENWDTTKKTVTLLQGVTGSGKTHIYIKAIEQALQKKQQILYLLPEILITTQLIQKIQYYFGGFVAYFHSKMSIPERLEVWRKVQQQEVSIIIGVRSSLFLPFNHLKLIICDEEHDPSYKQAEQAPRYNARDVAIWLATQSNIKIILGSATPSLESYYNAIEEKKYNYIELTQRYRNIPMPKIELFDLKKYIGGIRKEPWISPPLIEKIQTHINHRKQILFFQNRRGYAPYIVCENCGWIPYCENCHLPLSYHKFTHQLKCHTCNYTHPLSPVCPKCKQEKILYKQFGTEKLEEVLRDYFPNLKISRVDWDTTKSKLAFQKIIQLFNDQKIDAIVGTQMIGKGLDFPNLSLVVIPNADHLLFYQNFRNNERLFQIVEQVGGRAGRTETGEVFIQTTQTEHPIFVYLQQHNYHSFAKEELKLRKQFFYPPYSRTIKITIKHKQENLCRQGALLLYQQLNSQSIPHLYPPITPFAHKIKNLYLQYIYLKLPNQNHYLSQLKKYLSDVILNIRQSKELSSLQIIADVDNID